MTIQMKDLGKAVIETQYAVRGAIVAKANELEKQGKEIIYCNIGNPQSLGQKPMTYVRQLLALCEYPALMDLAPSLFPADIIETAKANGLEPYHYLRHLFEHLPAATTDAQRKALLPQDIDPQSLIIPA